MDWYQVAVVDAVALLDRLEQFVERGAEYGVPLHASLAKDMFGFSDQVQIAAGFTLRGAFPLCGRIVPELDETAAPAAAIATARDHLQSLHPGDFSEAATRVLEDMAGDSPIRLPADRFMIRYILPNLTFHMTCAYAILRHHGVPVGKEDFDGLHSYAPDFSFI
ncbi:DUF1993 family protein [Pontivivens insulae]|uniref:DUF1993 domain-containing protein n=1 Tax=Pontivivens insulae TaxID=1639689 RepID=A0A2R8AEJ4_9RHOB|nr:DUF1993 family protein [Pontivivens insulae]RED11903.1 hypothetical protein DFR53_2615 [Pontivivens insulae]SPF30659.1 hypothetical protein POI8812_03001 [Pontivivens insulae]